MTAQFLVRPDALKVLTTTIAVEPSSHTVLVHAAAGGVGSLLCQWASSLGATVIGTVSTEKKALRQPSLIWIIQLGNELVECANEVFAKVESGALRVHVNHTYPLSHAAQAHADLEARKTSGSVVLIPDTA
ncbi:putative quinone oxidoreductase [Cinnamomum micranthum f. kanehirae]|uniref:Putative quinone oxidoreductase n=1 Tax=Cinnamomum micranthum f. kanehirae TaxID=337451 RepID=A0A443PG92_9MAGN|nr:putative quinone oxidoreductase [Cinnamomum micranthum f. kanehirae]